MSSKKLQQNLQQNIKEICARLTQLENSLEHTRNGLRQLMEEDDFKNLPSYSLLSRVYSEYLVDVTEPKEKEKEKEIFDTLHMPPRLRARAKKSNIEEEPDPSTSRPKPAPSRPYANDAMPDLSESLLDDMGPKSVKAVAKAAPKAPVAKEPLAKEPPPKAPAPVGKTCIVKANGPVYTVEVQGVQYLKYKEYF